MDKVSIGTRCGTETYGFTSTTSTDGFNADADAASKPNFAGQTSSNVKIKRQQPSSSSSTLPANQPFLHAARSRSVVQRLARDAQVNGKQIKIMKHTTGFGRAKWVTCTCYGGSPGPKIHCRQHGSLTSIFSFYTQILRMRSARCKYLNVNVEALVVQ